MNVQQVSIVCDKDLIDRVDSLAQEYGIARQEVLQQVVEIGLNEVD